MIVDSLHHVGAARSIVIDEDDNILAGNGVVEAAAQAGIERVRVVEADGSELIAVRRRGLTEEQRQKLKYYDNQTGAIAEWDAEQIAADIEEGMDLKGIFDQKEIADILASMKGEPPEDPGAQIDRAAELQELWHTELGQLWELGEHRLICGDCTDRAVVERVMGGEKAGFCFTDPPYNVGLQYKNEESDELPREDYRIWCQGWLAYCPKALLVTPGVKHLLWWDSITGEPQWTAAWVKRNGQSQTGFLGTNKWDPILAYHCEPDHGIDIIEINNDYRGKISREFGHHGAKPTELWEAIISRFCPSGDVIYEPFLGSGTTLIACERLGRKCRAIEISPAYVAVSLQRWTDMVGKSPMLVT